ncbi:MAG TPA: DUF554 domain-containing protein [Eubacteriaceae bacterium]|nr:DUF554 domain-containing protein [Eubacteriaceae bacterium]
MQLLGTIVNSSTIIIGAIIGVIIKKGIPERINDTILKGLALGIMVYGISEGIKTGNLIIVLASLVLGGIIGEIIDIDKKLENLGTFIEGKFKNKGGNISQAFVTTSLMYCIGAMAITGALQSGLQNDHTTLYAKSLIDFVVSIIFGSTLGIGVALSGISVFIYQGSITLLAALLKTLLQDPVIREMTAIGGILIAGISLNMLGLTKIRLANLLPAVFIPIFIYMIYTFL